jgi:hypothetical protein
MEVAPGFTHFPPAEMRKHMPLWIFLPVRKELNRMPDAIFDHGTRRYDRFSSQRFQDAS